MSITYYSELISKNPVIKKIAESVHDIVLILDDQRRIVFYNSKFEAFAEEHKLKTELGLLPGEIFNCLHAFEAKQECGHTNFCKYCGANNALMESRKGERIFSECKIAALNGHAFELNVSATPITLEDVTLTLYCVVDVSIASRKLMLEKIFFHDINNIVSGMGLLIELLSDPENTLEEQDYKKCMTMLGSSMKNLQNEINSQRIITMAEKNELVINKEEFKIGDIINEIYDFFDTSDIGKGVRLVLDNKHPELMMVSDQSILKRVLTNMIKNACEASEKGEKVAVGCRLENDRVIICVHNKSVMSEEVQSYIFKKSFSTKGQGRGIGTYSIRLLSERYLKSKVYFTSKEGEGTTFYLEMPLSL